MAYQVAQLRRSNYNASTFFKDNILLTPTILNTTNMFGSEKNDFQDYALQLEDEGVFEQNKTYYIRFGIRKIFSAFYQNYYKNNRLDTPDADIMKITLLLKNVDEYDEETNIPQLIGTFTVGSKAISNFITTLNESEWELLLYFNDLNDQIEYQFYSFIFSPDKNYDSLEFRIQRNSYDVLECKDNIVSNSEFYDGRRWLLNDGLDSDSEKRKLRFSDGSYCTINSTFSSEAVSSTCVLLHNIAANYNTPWLKMGYQCRPGSLLVVNGEPIRLGRSGIYEINNGTKITSIMIPTLSDSVNDIDAFLLDYVYET